MRQKIQNLLTHLNHGLVERDATLKATLLSVLAGENIVLIGPPGTGKSMLARRIAQAFGSSDQQGDYFEYLLTKFSTPEELFGPLSISELKKDIFKRNTNGYLPSVELAFLDEIFKASSSILNALLTILNERVFHNGASAEPVPLKALIAASNELPTGQEELSALYDRFLVRSFVGYVSEEGRAQLFTASTKNAPTAEPITAQDLEALRQAAEAVTLPPTIQQALLEIWRKHQDTFKEDARESLSDRRLMKCLGLLRVSAATNGRDEVDLSDLLLLKDCLWNHPDNTAAMRQLVLTVLSSHSRPVLLGLEAATTTAPQPAPVAAPLQATGQMNALIKGWAGRGTEQDPLLIQTVDDLLDLARPEVGMQGYYFRVMQDIDCSEVTTWLDIYFKGFFDGNEREVCSSYQSKSNQRYIFKVVQEESVIKKINLKNIGLAIKVKDTEIIQCKFYREKEKEKSKSLTGFFEVLFDNSDGCSIVQWLINSDIRFCESDAILALEVSGSKIKNCSAEFFLISGKAIDSSIEICHANFQVCNDEIINSEIKNCSVKTGRESTTPSLGISSSGISKNKIKNSTIENIFIFGVNPVENPHQYGVANILEKSSLSNCVLGEVKGFPLKYRICQEVKKSSILANNYSIDVNKCNEHDIRQGKSIPAAIFNQRFFENNLGWDFENVWYWDDANNQPALRYVGANAQPPSEESSLHTSEQGEEELLVQQIRQNIWL